MVKKLNKQKSFNKNRARLEILNYIISFSTQDYYGNNTFSYSNADTSFHPGCGTIGSLVKISAAPTSIYYLSWLHETRKGKHGNTEYLLESIENGELCWWYNIGVTHFSPEKLKLFYNWRWTDEQFKFQEKWRRNVLKKHGLRIGKTEFSGNSVTLSLRKIFEDKVYYKEFSNWKKLTVSEMDKFYHEAEKYFSIFVITK